MAVRDEIRADTVPAETVFEVLAHKERSMALKYLQEYGASSLSTVAEEVAKKGERSNASDRLAISLHHVHIPKLVAAGLVRYDGNVIEPTRRLAQLSLVSGCPTGEYRIPKELTS